MTNATPFELWLQRLKERLASGEHVELTTEGHSMWPAFRAGQRVVIAPVVPTSLGIGDVVLVVAAQRLLLHRIIGLRPDSFLLKGDATPSPDGWCSSDRVIGVAPCDGCGATIAIISRVGGAPLARLTGIVRRLHAGIVTRCCPAGRA